MKTIFDAKVREELVARINGLDERSPAKWGKMNLRQMLKHCVLFDEWVQGVNAPLYKQSFLGLLFGKMALKSALKDDKPMARNMPAGAGFAVRDDSGETCRHKARWAELISGYGRYSNPAFIHDFFGRMSEEQIGRFAYKHADHHLRQFGG